jgi:hypothetical protein
MRPGDTAPIRAGRTLRVVATVVSADDEPTVLVVEETSE